MANQPTTRQQLRTISTARPLVLASGSPRRSAILESLGFSFRIVPADLDESAVSAADPARLALKLAESKAELVTTTEPASCVLAADTVVALEGETLGKPADADEAESMLKRLTGQTHDVHTAVAVRVNGRSHSGVDTTAVTIRSLDNDEIASYIASGKPMDKAGAYGIQDSEFAPVESFAGSYSNVVGLPVTLLADLLLAAGQIDEPSAAFLRGSDAS